MSGPLGSQPSGPLGSHPSGPLDQHARDIAATEFAANVVVVAGAGSGKTTLLVQRLLNLLLGRGIPLSSIVALTFTEKAAAEMRERLATQLSRSLEILAGSSPMGADPASWSIEWVTLSREVGGAGVTPAQARERALAAMSELDGGALGTIHAYCADLLRRHPREARLDPSFVVDDGSRLALIVDDEWVLFEAETLALGSAQEADWRIVLQRFDVSLVRAAAEELVAKCVTDASDSEARAVDLLRSGVATVREALASVATLATNKRAHERAEILGGCLGAWEKDGAASLRSRWIASELGDKGLPAAGKGSANPDAAKHALTQGDKLVKALLQVDEACTGALMRLALELAARVRERLAREGITTFQGLLVGARDLLLSDPVLRRAEHERVQAILLDEFQDTDPLQYEIAFLLGEDDSAPPVPAGGDAWEARLAPGRLFIVGDPKQSIYRFRGADMASYERAVRALSDQGAKVLSLVANFRSRAEVLAPINDLCDQLIQEDPPYQPAYESLHAARGDAEAGERRVEIWTVTHDGDGADRHRLAEARAIGRWLFERRTSGELPSYGHAALLFRAMTSVAIYQRGLFEQGVPFVTQGGKGFSGREEVVQAVALLRALVRPNDAASLLALLRSPSCGASDVELRRFAALTNGRWSMRAAVKLTEGEREQVPRVARALDGMSSLAELVRHAPADEAIRRVLTEQRDEWSPHLVPIHAASHGGAQRLANLEKLVTRAEELVRAEGLSLQRVVERLWTEMEEGSDQGESPLADEAVDAARLMSIHQCKGLEFPVVIVPDLARSPVGGGSGRGASVKIETRGGLLAVDAGSHVKNHASLVISRANQLHDEAESARLLYVALTRAMERLILVNANRAPKANAWPMDPIRSIWGHEPSAEDPGLHLHPQIEHHFVDEPTETREAGHAAPMAELIAAVLARDAAEKRLEAAARPRARSATGLKEASIASLDAREFSASDAGVARGAERGEALSEDAAIRPTSSSWSRPGLAPDEARAVGIAVHHALEVGMLDELMKGDAKPDAKRAKGWDELARRAAALGAAEVGAKLATVEAETLRLIRALPGSGIARALSGARVLAKELPFLLELDGVAWQGFIDLVIEKDGAVIVVDWKTDRAQDATKHRAQLTLYAEAVRRWRGLSNPARMALAWIDGGSWEEL